MGDPKSKPTIKNGGPIKSQALIILQIMDNDDVLFATYGTGEAREYIDTFEGTIERIFFKKWGLADGE